MRHMKPVASVLSAFLSLPCLASLPAFPDPTTETRPWGICHWLGNAVETEELAKETARWAEAGLGGYRIVPIYGAKGFESRNAAFMSPEFLDRMADARRLAAAKGMKVDMSFGAGWCFGGTTIPKELGIQGLKVLKDGERAPKRSRTLWEGEGRRLVSYYTGQAVKRAQKLDAGPMLNPFSPAALDAHLKLFAPLDARRDAFPRATFHDSFEYYSAAWSDELPGLFLKYRGYRLEDHFAELAGVGDPETVARVKCDFRETLSDVLVKETFPKWTAWCRARGIETHNQAHGAPANLLEFYALADTPETEMFGRGDRDRFRSGFDARFREGDRSILMSKFASSAAHLAGKRFTSAEAFTWMGEHFCETLEEAKAFGDLLFLSGVNRLYYHATVYSPDSAPWPGWCFYAASELNPRNPAWRDIRPLNDYFTRVQTLTASATPDNDVLLYWPVHDQWTKAEGFAELLTIHSRWFKSLPFGKLAERLDDAGYQFDYTSDAFLSDEIVRRYKAIVVPETKFMKAATLARLAELAKTMPVIFEKSLPASEPGLRGRALSRPQGLEPAPDALAALAKTPARPVAFATAESGLDAVRYPWNGGTLHFVVNSTMEEKTLSAAGLTVMDPMSGEVATRETLVLAPAQSTFLFQERPCGSAVRPSPSVGKRSRGNAILSGSSVGPWSLEFVRDVSGWKLPATRTGDVLGDWTRFGEPEAEFSGTAVYRTTFAADRTSDLTLDLGEVCHSARVIVNGRNVATLFMHPYRCVIPAAALVTGTNTLEVEVTNLGANRIRAYDRKGVVWKTFEDANLASYRGRGLLDASAWPVLPSGLIGPVRLARPGSDGFDAPWFLDKSPVDETKLGRLRPVSEFGVRPDVPELQTAALQRAIDAIATDGGGVLVLGAGVWNSSSLFFRPGVHLKLEKGAVLRGPADGAATPRIPTRMEGESVVYNAALVNADRCDGFTLYGEGTIDGNGAKTWAAFWAGRAANRKAKKPEFRNMTLDRPRNVYVSNSRDVRVSGLRIKDSHFWTTHFYRCERVRIDRVRITASGPKDPVKAPSSDAIDLDVVRDVHIWDSYFDVNDDGIALKGGKGFGAEKKPENGPNSMILVENCTFGPVTHSALTCGSEAVECRDVVVRDCALDGCGNLLNLKSRPDTRQVYDGIRIERVGGSCRNALVMKPWTQYFTLPEGESKQRTEAHGIVFRDCSVKGRVEVKLDESFMSLDRPIFENCPNIRR